jgi:Holliday junction resolvase
MRRHPAKRDRVEDEIVRRLRAAGFSVQPLIGDGVPDLLIARNGREALIEVKSGNKPLRPSQVEWHANWRGPKPLIVRSVEEAHDLIQTW